MVEPTPTTEGITE
jgi:tryptophanyl-tRNA synthetase